MVIETMDALRCYHEAANTNPLRNTQQHTILILDKALHLIPWESLPCLNGVSVSRVPSLGCLRERIISQRNDIHDNGPEGVYVDSKDTAYVLNPAGDLKSTQAVFE